MRPILSTATLPMLLLATRALAQAPPAAPPRAPAPATPVTSSVAARLYGFVELDAIEDSTQSFGDLAGNTPIARPGTYAAEHRRFQMGIRNSRVGVKLSGPSTTEVKTGAVVELDLFGNQPPSASEAAFFNNGAMRVRHAAVKVETPIIDVLAGQSWQLFGWQPYFHPNTVAIQGIPGQVYSRTAQVRLSNAFVTEALTVELAIAALRPAQRDADVPDGQGGMRLLVNGWKGLRTVGATGTSIDALSIGISGLARRFAVSELAATPAASKTRRGWGISLDALVPVIPATDERKANALTLTGSFVAGAGIADMFTGLTGGVAFPAPPNPSGATPPPAYVPDIDNGLVTYDTSGRLRTIGWRSLLAGAQYHLPPSGAVWISVDYSQMKSDDAAKYGARERVFDRSRFVDGNLFWDVNDAVRVGAAYAWFEQTYADGVRATNHRVQTSAFYRF